MQAILADRRLGLTDTTLLDGLLLQEYVLEQGQGWGLYLELSRKGPLSGILVCGMAALVGDHALAARVLSILLHAALLMLVFRLASRVSGRPSTGLLAAAICGTFPGEYGWFRLPYHDALAAVAMVLILDQLCADLRRPASAVRLGLTAGIGFLAKTALPLYAVAPGLVWLLGRLRRPRQLKLAALALAVMAGTCGWWVLLQWDTMTRYLGASQQHQIPVTGKLEIYFLHLPLLAPFLGCALLGAVAARWTRAAGDQQLVLLLSAVLAPLGLLLLFDTWTRYLLPIFPAAGVLSALGLGGLISVAARRRGRRLAGGLALALVLLLLGRHLHDNLVGYPAPRRGREFGTGLVSPDRRPYTAYPRMVRLIRKQKLQVLQFPMFEDQLPISWGVWRRRGFLLPELAEPVTLEALEGRAHIHCVVFHQELDVSAALARARPHHIAGPELLQLINNSQRLLLRTFADPDGSRFSLVRVYLR